MAGKNSVFWRGGVNSLRNNFYRSAEYRSWRSAVFHRDDFTCRICGKKGSKLEADHIKPAAHFPELKLDINNGRTLCQDCHKQTDTYGSRTLWRKYEKS
jgi:5-methylcytosine-specific restriction endonuclease McrA